MPGAICLYCLAICCPYHKLWFFLPANGDIQFLLLMSSKSETDIWGASICTSPGAALKLKWVITSPLQELRALGRDRKWLYHFIMAPAPGASVQFWHLASESSLQRDFTGHLFKTSIPAVSPKAPADFFHIVLIWSFTCVSLVSLPEYKLYKSKNVAWFIPFVILAPRRCKYRFIFFFLSFFFSSVSLKQDLM